MIDFKSNLDVKTPKEIFAEINERFIGDVDVIVMVDGAIAQPVKSTPYSAEKIPLSEAYGIELFYHYGTKSVMPDLIFKNKKGE